MFDITRLLTSVASDAIGLRGKRGRRTMGFLGGRRRSFLGPSSLIGIAGLAVGAYQIFKDKSGSAPSAPRRVEPGTTVIDAPPSTLGAARPAESGDRARSDPSRAALALEELPLRAVRLMIAAARCDGTLGEEELGRLLSHARDAGLEAQMRSEWQAPRPLSEICAGIESPEHKRELYVLAYSVLRADDEVSGAERIFLAQLAARLALTPEIAASIERDTAQQIDLAG
jgi:uncharacterized membrane protein YebE (DUF533 family)